MSFEHSHPPGDRKISCSSCSPFSILFLRILKAKLVWLDLHKLIIINFSMKVSMQQLIILFCNKNWYAITILFVVVSFHMIFHISRLYESLLTLCATIWLFSCVSLNMKPQSSWPRKSFLTKSASKRFFTCVHPHVNLKLVLPYIFCVTIVASMRSVISMSLSVLLQISLGRTTFSTVQAADSI